MKRGNPSDAASTASTDALHVLHRSLMGVTAWLSTGTSSHAAASRTYAMGRVYNVSYVSQRAVPGIHRYLASHATLIAMTQHVTRAVEATGRLGFRKLESRLYTLDDSKRQNYFPDIVIDPLHCTPLAAIPGYPANSKKIEEKKVSVLVSAASRAAHCIRKDSFQILQVAIP
jgi:hypothetical protein